MSKDRIQDLIDQGELENDQGNPDVEAWEDPVMIDEQGREPFPIDSLPDLIKDAVHYASEYVQAPVPLIVASALSALSLACQGLVDVMRPDGKRLPTSLYLITVGDPGERKTTCDDLFLSPIRNFQDRKDIEMKGEIQLYETDMEFWKAKRSGLTDKIRKVTKDEKSGDDCAKEIENLYTALKEHDNNKPEKPVVPTYIRQDETPDSLAHSMATGWPSAGLVSSEAGQFLGGYSMNKDSRTRMCGMLNSFWSNDPYLVNRKTSDPFRVAGVRMTLALQIQERVLQDFNKQSGNLMRNIGLFSRALFSFPESTQGNRFYKMPGENEDQSLEFFYDRITKLLEMGLETDENGRLVPTALKLDEGAGRVWIDFYNEVEASIKGQFEEIKDMAGKAAENALRLAASFCRFMDGKIIDVKIMKNACIIVRWYLSETNRSFGKLDALMNNRDLVTFEKWIIRKAQNGSFKMTIREIQLSLGKGPIRDGGSQYIKELLEKLKDRGLVNIRDGSSASRSAKVVTINPKVIEATR